VSEFGNWGKLLNHLQQISLDPNTNDSAIWAPEKKGYTTKFLYRFLSNRGFPNRIAAIIWKCRIPLKIKFFLWQMFNNKLPVDTSLIKRGWKGSGKCCLSDVWESIDHIMFHCVLAKLCWSILGRFLTGIICQDL